MRAETRDPVVVEQRCRRHDLIKPRRNHTSTSELQRPYTYRRLAPGLDPGSRIRIARLLTSGREEAGNEAASVGRGRPSGRAGNVTSRWQGPLFRVLKMDVSVRPSSSFVCAQYLLF
jgi:hypothetical protein